MSHAPSDREIPDLSTLTPAEYAKLDRQNLELIHRLAFRANQGLTHRAFADQSVAWILIAGAPGRIVAQGKRDERISDAQINALEERIGQVCYFYSRPDELVEEVPAGFKCDEPRFPWAAPQTEPLDPSRPIPIGPYVDVPRRARASGGRPHRLDYPPLEHDGYPPPDRMRPADPNR
ncbi:MAG: hypothetical protein WC641_04745 [Patescibacteria group bacterium]